MNRPELIAALGVALAMGGLLAGTLQTGWPHVGFDFSYFLPRLLDVHLHHLQEGWLSVQWWTPSFGAGLPAFFNPQHTQFTLAQLLVPMLGPWIAAVAQAALFTALGVFLVYWVCRRRFGYTMGAALLAAVTFGTGGFLWEHTLTGHMSFATFPLVAIIPEALHRAVTARRGVMWLAVAGAVIVFGGGYAIIMIFVLTSLLLAGLLPLWRPVDYPARSVITRLMLGAVAACAIAAAKITAVAMFLGPFPRLVEYRFEGQRGWEIASLAWQALGRRTLLLLTRWLPFSGDEPNAWLGRGEDVGYGPVAAVLLMAGGCILLQRRIAAGSRPVLGPMLGFLAALWITAEFVLARGVLWPWLQPLPFLRSFHENHRLAAAFALPLALAIAPCWNALMRNQSPRVIRVSLIAALMGTVASLEYYVRTRDSFWHGSFDASTITATWQELQRNPDERFAISRVADVRDDGSFMSHASSWKPYEPVFGYGYGGFAFRTGIEPGPIELQAGHGGSWRFHDPRQFIARGGAPFALVPSGEAPQLKRFLSRRQPTWQQPWSLRAAWAVSLASGVLVLACLCWPARAPAASSGARPRMASPVPARNT